MNTITASHSDLAKGDLTEMTLTRSDVPRPVRFAASALFVAVWVALGYLFHLSANAYLLAGIPLTVLFQVVVKKEPLRALWLRPAQPVVATRRFAATGLLLVGLPAYSLYQAVVHHNPIEFVLWYVACLCGVFGAAYAVSRLDRSAVKVFGVYLGIAAWMSGVPLVLAALARHSMGSPHPGVVLAYWFLLYFPVTFLLEEVTFRGAIDAYVHRPGETQPFWSAFFVSALWGLWHLPIVPHVNAFVPIELIIFHALLGVPLSYAWRKTGNLAVPAAVHAIVDAVRNTLGLM